MACLPATAAAQHILFEEAFEGGLPATWTNIHKGAHIDPWLPGFRQVDGTRDIYQESFCTNGFTMRDNILLSPVIDLSGVAKAYLQVGQYQRFPGSRLQNTVEVTTDGGQSYTVVYTENGTFTGFGLINADLSQWAGNPNVQVAFHYRGTIANEWSIDNVRVTSSPVRHISSELLQGQPATFAVVDGTPGSGAFLFLSGTGAGPLPSRWGNINLFPPLLPFPGLVIDGNGRAVVVVPVPVGTAGIRLYTQAIELTPPSTIKLTNSLARTIQ
jgi:hypothetical protein